MTTWLTEKAGATPFESVLAHRPELLAGYRAFYRSIWSAGLVPARILELCRLRVAAIHGCAAEWNAREPGVQLDPAELDALERGLSTPFDEAESAALAVAERVPYQHHEISDEEVERVRAVLGEPGCVSLLNALVLFDANCRLKLTLGIEAAGDTTDDNALR